MARKIVRTTLDENLYRKIKILAAKLDCYANDLIEQGMILVLDKHGEDSKSNKYQNNPEENKE